MRKAGQIVLFEFPRGDIEPGKLRPTLLLSGLPGSYQTWLICMISTQLHQKVDGFDEIVTKKDNDFIQSGFKTSSLIRLGRLAVVNDDILTGPIGRISTDRLYRLRNNLSSWLKNEEDLRNIK